MEYTYCEESFSDIYKDVHGFRPRQHEFWIESPERKQQIWDALLESSRIMFLEQEQEEKESIIKFENKIQELINIGAGDKKTAIRWLIEAEGDTDGDMGYFCYKYHLPYYMESMLSETLNTQNQEK